MLGSARAAARMRSDGRGLVQVDVLARPAAPGRFVHVDVVVDPWLYLLGAPGVEALAGRGRVGAVLVDQLH